MRLFLSVFGVCLLLLALALWLPSEGVEAATRDEDGNITEISRLEQTAFLTAWSVVLGLVFIMAGIFRRGGGKE